MVAISAYVSRLLATGAFDNSSGDAVTCEEFDGAVLFVDIADSTSIVNQFAEEGPEGVEQLSRLFNRYFGELFDIVERRGGDVIRIHGDAVIAVWRSEEGLGTAAHRAAQAALALREGLHNGHPESATLLRHRIVLSGGRLSARVFRGEGHQSFFVVAGEPILALASASHGGTPDDVVLTDALVPYFAGEAVERSQGGFCTLKSLTGETPALHDCVERPIDERADRRARGFVPQMLASRVLDGDSAWLAEFRVLSVVFVHLAGVERASAERVNGAIAAIQQAIQRFGIALFDLTVDDKGVVALIACGLPPFAQERNAVRALEGARQIRAALRAIDIESSIGVCTGRAFCGDVGNSVRRECLITGPVMHRGARLMQAAAGSILFDGATAAASAEYFKLPQSRSIVVRGSAEPLIVYGGEDLERPARAAERRAGALFGRDDETRSLDDAFDAARSRSVVLVIEGEPGAGKSRLLGYVGAQAHERHLTTVESATSLVELTTPYFSCRAILRQLLLRSDDSPTDEAALLRTRLADAVRGDPLEAKAALIEDILPLGMEHKGLASEMTGPARIAGIEDLFVCLARRRAGGETLVLLIDDVHWLDDRSARLLLAVARRLQRVLIALASRPLQGDVAPNVRSLYESARFKLSLRRLGPEPIVRMTCELLGVRSIPPRLGEFVYAHSEGLPFHAEQLVLSLRDQGVLSVADGRCRVTADLSSQIVPDSLRDLIVSRIDTLDATHQIVVKIASAIGRSFRVDLLRDLLPLASESARFDKVLEELVGAGILAPGDGADANVRAFRHILIQEATYELLTFEQRKPLHRRIVAFIERTYSRDLEPHFAELADHCERGEELDKAISYRQAAAVLALARYANHDALSHAERVQRLAARAPTALGAVREGELARIRADACHELSRFAEAQEHFRRCAALNGIRVPTTRRQVVASAVLEMGRQLLHRFAVGRRAEDDDVRRRDRLAAHIYTRFAEHAYFTGDALLLLHGTLTSLNRAENVGAVAEITEGYGGLAIGLGTAGCHRLARYYRDRSIVRAETEGRLHDQGFAHLLAAVYSFQAGDWQATDAHCAKGAMICERIGDRFRHQSCCVIQAYAHMLRGRYDEAEKLLGSLGEDAEAVENIPVRAWVLAGRAIVDMVRGRSPTTAIARISSARDETLHGAERLLCDGLDALAHLQAGDTERALKAADAALANMSENPPTMGIALLSVMGVAEVYVTLAERSPNAGTADRLLACARGACRAARGYAGRIPIASPRYRLLSGRLAMLLRRPARAHSSWRRALAEATGFAMPLEQALCLLALSSSDADPGQRLQYEQAGRRMLAQLGANPWRYARDGPPHGVAPAAAPARRAAS